MKPILTIISILILIGCNTDGNNKDVYIGSEISEDADEYRIVYDTISRLPSGVFLVNVQCFKDSKIVAEDIVKFDCDGFKLP